jgi:hypothetical protein
LDLCYFVCCIVIYAWPGIDSVIFIWSKQAKAGWRTDYNAINRTVCVDPLCEKYYWITPYAMNLNNPIRFVDPDGLKVEEKDGKYVITGDDVYAYYGYIDNIKAGSGFFDNMMAALRQASERNNGEGGNIASTIDETTVWGKSQRKYDMEYGAPIYVNGGMGEGSQSTARICGPPIYLNWFFSPGTSASSKGQVAYELAKMFDNLSGISIKNQATSNLELQDKTETKYLDAGIVKSVDYSISPPRVVWKDKHGLHYFNQRGWHVGDTVYDTKVTNTYEGQQLKKSDTIMQPFIKQ